MGLCWSTYFSWITRKLDQKIQQGADEGAGDDGEEGLSVAGQLAARQRDPAAQDFCILFDSQKKRPSELPEQPPSVVRLTVDEYAERWETRLPLPEGTLLEGLCGRFIRGTRPEDFEMLSDEPGKKLSWVSSQAVCRCL